MKKVIHPIAGTIAMLCIGSFWLSTLISELFLSQESILLVKHAILQAMWVMIPAMAITGGSGFALSSERKGNLLAGKKRRMQFIAANGIFDSFALRVLPVWQSRRGRNGHYFLCAASGGAFGRRHKLQPDGVELS